MASGIGFNESLFTEAGQDGENPVGVGRIAPFSAGPAGNLFSAGELSTAGAEIQTNFFFIGIHSKSETDKSPYGKWFRSSN